MRLFIGVAYQASPAVQRLLAELRDMAAESGLRVVPETNLHITLKFLGSVTATREAAVIEAMQRGLDGCREFDVRLRGIGCFSRSIWLGLDDGGEFARLVARLDESLAQAGFPAEKRAFHPHLTVARMSRRARLSLSSLQERHAHTDWGTMHVDAVHLYQSRTLPEGPRYSIRHTESIASASDSPG